MKTSHRRTMAMLLGLLPLCPTGGHAQIAVISDLAAERVVRPGESYQGALLIKNTSGTLQQVKVYQTDYLFYADGRTLYDVPGSHARSSARWVQFSPANPVVPPGEVVTVAYRVDVPEADTLSGTYWSMLMVEAVPPGSPEYSGRQARDRITVGVQTLVRYGTQLATHVGEAAEPVIEFTAPGLTEVEGGGRALDVTLRNPGARAFRPSLRLELYSEAGVRVWDAEAKQSLLYPETSLRQRFALGALPPGRYTALLVADTGGGELFGAQYHLEL